MTTEQLLNVYLYECLILFQVLSRASWSAKSSGFLHPSESCSLLLLYVFFYPCACVCVIMRELATLLVAKGVAGVATRTTSGLPNLEITCTRRMCAKFRLRVGWQANINLFFFSWAIWSDGIPVWRWLKGRFLNERWNSDNRRFSDEIRYETL